MKLSSLNRFKGKDVTVTYYDEINRENLDVTGKVEEITPDFITIDYETGLQNISIEQIRQIEEVEKVSDRTYKKKL